MTVHTNFLPIIWRHPAVFPRGWRFIPAAFHHIFGNRSTSRQARSYHFLVGGLLACHRGISFCSDCISSQHRVAAQPGTASSWDKQHCNTGVALSSKWQYVSVAGPDRLLSALCAALSCEVILVTHSIWFGHMAMGCLVKPGAVLSSPAKEFHSAFMLLMGLFIMPLQDWGDMSILEEPLKLLLSPSET